MTRWTGTYTSTYATEVSTLTDANGVTIISTLYRIETPRLAYYGNSKKTEASLNSFATSNPFEQVTSVQSTMPVTTFFSSFGSICSGSSQKPGNSIELIPNQIYQQV